MNLWPPPPTRYMEELSVGGLESDYMGSVSGRTEPRFH